MNAPFKIQEVLADAAVGITDLKRNPSAVIEEARHRQVAILNRNRPVAYVISPEVWEYLNDVLADRDLEEKAMQALEQEDSEAVEIDLDEYLQD